MWIREHTDAAARANKPVLLEEYGVGSDNSSTRSELYASWLRLIEDSGALGDLVWMLGLPKNTRQPYAPDAYVIQDGPEVDVIRQHAQTLCNSERS